MLDNVTNQRAGLLYGYIKILDDFCINVMRHFVGV